METISSKILRAQDIEEFKEWQLPTMDLGRKDAGEEHGREDGLPTAAQLEEIHNKAFEEGFAQGKADGFEYGRKQALGEGRTEVQRYVEYLEALLRILETPLKVLDEQVEKELVTLVISMVRQLVRREIRTDPNQIIGVVREALAILPLASRNVQLVLHPEDAELVKKIYTLGETELGWRIVEDPVLARGGCKVVTDTSYIDATLESRLSSLIAPLLAGERSDDTVKRPEE